MTGPLPGQFDPAWQATDSYFRMVNDLGGICGRKVQLIIRDDGENGPQDYQVAQQEATQDKIFAFVGSVSAPDDSGIGKISGQYHIPDIGFPLTISRTENPYTYGAPGQLQKNLIGWGGNGSAYLNAKYGVKQVAMFWVDESDVSKLNAWAFEAAMKYTTHNAINICYEQPTTVLDSSFTQYVINMQSACSTANGPIGVYTTMENNNNIKLAQAMRDQNFQPAVFVPTFTSYLQSFITQAGGSTNGAYIPMPQIPFERLTDTPQSGWTPGTFELQRYINALHRYHPESGDPGSWGAPAWGQSELFTEAAIACGAALTRTCILHQLDTMGPFSDHGMLSPTVPGTHHIYTPETMVQVQGNRFVEVPHPGKTGPPGATDFWNQSQLINWWDYYCNNKSQFPNQSEKNKYITCS
jgi:ABC-type branched-subunit amino acid transport system substrate-binding protein